MFHVDTRAISDAREQNNHVGYFASRIELTMARFDLHDVILLANYFGEFSDLFDQQCEAMQQAFVSKAAFLLHIADVLLVIGERGRIRKMEV